MILVTGGTGLVGAHLLLHLLGKETPIKAIHRKKSNLQQVKKVFSYYTEYPEELFNKIHWVEADLNDIPSLEMAFEDVTHVYHCAALISFDPGDYEKMQHINVVGTANIVNLCLAKHVQKLCYVSSIAAIGRGLDDSAATEENEWTDLGANVYALTKYDAETEIWRGTQEGLPVVTVNPGIILGPGFWHKGSGVLFKIAAKGPRYYPPGGTGVITVNDVVELMVQLMESSHKNERFIAVSKNLSYKEILSTIASALGKPTPKKVLKFWHLKILWRLDWCRSLLTNQKRRLTKMAVESLKHQQIYSNKKVSDLLDPEFGLLADTIYFSCNRFMEENP